MQKNNAVLIVDDEETDRYLLTRNLKKQGYSGKIFEAEDGQKAIEFLGRFDVNTAEYGDHFPPTIIFLDVNMPVMNGLEFLEKFDELKANDNRYSSVVIMMYTSSEQKEDIEKSTSYDFVREYMIKNKFSFEPVKSLLNIA